MHVMIPKAFGWYPSNSFYTEPDRQDGKPIRRFHAWLSKREDMEDNFLDLSYFKEHRRPNYSDVCHSKLDSFHEILDGSGPWEIVPPEYPDTPGHRTHWRLPGYYTGEFSWDLAWWNYGPGGMVYFGFGNGQTYVYGVCECESGGSGPYLAAEIAIWRRRASQPQKNRIYFWSTKGRMYYRYRDGSINYRSKTGPFSSDSTFKAFAALWDNQPMPSSRSERMAVAKAMADSLRSFLRAWLLNNSGDSTTGSSYWSYPSRPGEVLIPQLGEQNFLLHEPEAIMDGTDDMLFGRGFQHYWREVATQHAYLDALQHVPRMSENMISNMLEITGFIKSLVVDHRVEIPKSLSDLWLAYRYTYGTTKVDADEAVRFVHRHKELGQWTHLKTYGSYTFDYEGTRIRCRCELEVYPKALKTLQKVWHSLYTYGLSPSFYAVWDMIPYSFIVDWFLPIGDVMAAWDAEREYKMAYDLKDINFSLEYVKMEGDFPIHCYTRWYSPTPKPLQGYYFLEDDPSTKTIVKRIIDAGALILG